MLRRDVLASVFALTVSAGCSEVTDRVDRGAQEGFRINSVTLENQDKEPHVFHVIILDEGDVTTWTSTKVGPAFEDDLLHAETHSLSSVPNQSGQYSILARVDDESAVKRLSGAELSDDVGCINVEIQVDVRKNPSIVHSTDC